jgi:protein gp37
MAYTVLARPEESTAVPSPCASPSARPTPSPCFQRRDCVVSFESNGLAEMLSWRKPRRIFFDLESDIFGAVRHDSEIDATFGLMWANLVLGKAPRHTFYILTRNPERMRAYLSGNKAETWAAAASHLVGIRDRGPVRDAVLHIACQPHPHLALGVQIESQDIALSHIPILLETPAARRWLNVEPALSPIDLGQWIAPRLHCSACGSSYGLETITADESNPFGSDRCTVCSTENCMSATWGDEAARGAPDEIPMEEWDRGYRLHWVRAGGEKGEHARPSHPDWMRSLRDQCARAQIPFHFSGWGAWRPICQGGENWYASLYRSRRRARNPEDQAALDDVWGKRCSVPQVLLHRDGRHQFDLYAPGAWGPGTGAVLAFHALRKPELHLLDGARHAAYPD